jgi:4,5-DOPA dioxygenase extradiol
MKLAPLLFVSHGSPMFANDSGQAAQNLAAQTSRFDDVEAILVISPHWMTRGNYVTTNEAPETIHDFGGFSPELYQLQYPAPGSNRVARLLIKLLNENNVEAKADDSRGWDHGAWVPLRHLRPQADKPLVQLSLNAEMSPDDLIHLGQVLQKARQKNIAIICSGAVTHNLYDIRQGHHLVAKYAKLFEEWVRTVVVEGNIEDAKQPHIKSLHYEQAHPTPEHYLPLLIAMSASDEREKVTVLSSPILHHSISMESYVWT